MLQAIIGNYAVPILEERQVWGTSDETRTAYMDSTVQTLLQLLLQLGARHLSVACPCCCCCCCCCSLQLAASNVPEAQ